MYTNLSSFSTYSCYFIANHYFFFFEATNLHQSTLIDYKNIRDNSCPFVAKYIRS